jgi:hypothetical protein
LPSKFHNEVRKKGPAPQPILTFFRDEQFEIRNRDDDPLHLCTITPPLNTELFTSLKKSLAPHCSNFCKQLIEKKEKKKV